MKSRPLILIASLVGPIGWLAILHHSGPKEPTYQGRTLDEWISVFYSGYSGNSTHRTPEEKEASEAAIRAMGTNSIPFLVTWLQRDDSNWRSSASEVFGILGEIGRPAAPALAQLTTNGNSLTRLKALLCLGKNKARRNQFMSSVLVQSVRDP